MKKITIVILSIFLTSVTFSQTQSSMNEKAKEKYEKEDAELNKVYKKILHEYATDTKFIKNLRETQKIWIKFRDAQTNMRYPLEIDGSARPMCRYNYLNELTSDRIKQLNLWIEGIEEGDVCSGTIKIK